MKCDFCQGNHPNGECTASPSHEEQVNYMDAQRHNFYSNTYIPGYRDHTNCSRNQGAFRHPCNPPAQEKKPNLKDMFQQFMQTHSSFVDKDWGKNQTIWCLVQESGDFHQEHRELVVVDTQQLLWMAKK